MQYSGTLLHIQEEFQSSREHVLTSSWRIDAVLRVYAL